MADINDYLGGLNYTFTPEEKQLMDIFAECWEYCQNNNVHCKLTGDEMKGICSKACESFEWRM